LGEKGRRTGRGQRKEGGRRKGGVIFSSTVSGPRREVALEGGHQKTGDLKKKEKEKKWEKKSDSRAIGQIVRIGGERETARR